MGFFDLFRPKWKHPEPEVRASVVEKENIEGQAVLAAVAKPDEGEGRLDVRKLLLRCQPTELQLALVAKQACNPMPGVYRESSGDELGSERVMQVLEAAEMADLHWAQDVLDRSQAADRLASLGKFSEAIVAYEQVLADAPFDPILSMSLGSCYAEMGDYDQAKRHAKAAHDMEPGNERIIANFQRIRTMCSVQHQEADIPANTRTQEPRITAHVSDAEDSELAELLASAERMARDARRRYEQAVDDFEEVQGFRPQEPGGSFSDLVDSLHSVVNASSDPGLAGAELIASTTAALDERADQFSYAYFLCFRSADAARDYYHRVASKQSQIAERITWRARVELRVKAAVMYPHWIVIYTPRDTLGFFHKEVGLPLEYDDHDEGGPELIAANSSAELVESTDIA